MRKARVVRFDLWLDPAFDERLAREKGVTLEVCAVAGAAERAWSALAAAHVYQISAARDELPHTWQAGEALLKRCPQLLCVSSGGAGYDTVDVAACTKFGVAVVNQAGANAVSVAEHALACMLALSRRIVECDRRLRRERGFTREDLMGREISGKVLGIVGIGHVGTRVAALARAFGMQVLAVDPYLTEEEIARRGAKATNFADLLERADIVSLHCPLDDSTRGMMGARAFQSMKPRSIFVSTARGGIHDEAALAQAIGSGHIAGAGLDVWTKEPPPLDHPLLGLDTVLCTYHTAGVTHEARRNIAAMSAEQIVGLLQGARPPRLINPEVWPAYAVRFEKILGIRMPRSPQNAE